MKNFFDDEFASEEAKAGSPLDVLFSDIDIDKVLSSAPMFGGTYAQTLARKKSDEVKTPEQAPSLFERFFKREKEPDAYGGITPYAVYPERKNNVAPALPDPVWEMEEALRAEAARRRENPTTFGYFSNHDFNRDADADAARRAEELKAKAEAERKLQAAFDAGERQRREKSGMGLYIPESVDMASSGTLPDEEAVRRVLASAVSPVVEKDAELPPDRSLLEKMSDPQWQYEMERNIARIKEAEAIGAKRDDGKKEPTSGREEAKRSYAGPNAPLDLSGLEKDPAHFGKAIWNIIPMHADSMSKSTLVSAFEKEQAMQAKGAENIFKETDAYLRTRRPTEEDIARIKSEPAVPFSLEGGRQSGLTDVEAAMLMQADAAERKGDFEKAKRLREEVAKHVVDIAERADALAKWSEENRVQYERPAGYWHNAVLNTIESSGHTIGSAIRSGAAWALGGPVAGLVMSFVNTGMEAESEAGQALHRLIEKGEKSPEEMRKAVEAARGRNVALLSVTNPLGDWLLFGTGKIASSVAKTIPGKTVLAKTMREAVQKIFPFVAHSAPEAVEEMGQTYITSLATGDPLKENELRDSAVQGALGSVIYGGVGKAAKSVVNFTKESLSKGKSSAVTESFLAGVVLSQRGKSFMENAESVAKFNKVDGVDKLEIALMPEGLQRDYFLLQRAQELIEEGKYTEATDLMTGKIRGEDADTLIFTPKALAFKALSETKVRLDKEKAAESEYGVLDVADAFMEERDYDGALRVLNAYNGKSIDAPVSAVEEAKAEEVKAAPVEADVVEETPVFEPEVVEERVTPVSNERGDPLQESLDGFGNEFDRLVGELGKIDKDLADAAVQEMERRKEETAAKNPVIQSSTRVEITEPGKKSVVIEGENWKDALDKASAVESEVISSTPVASAPVATPAEAPAPSFWWQDAEIVDAERALVKARVKKDLIAVGTSEEVAEAQSAVMAQGVVASARREANPDLSPLAWYEKFAPSIGMGKAPAAKAPAVKEEVAPVGVEVAPTQEAVPPVVEAPAPKGSLVDNGAHSFVDVASIAPVGDRASFDQDKIEAMADEMLRVGVLPEPLLVRRTGGDTFEVVGDGLRYWAAVRAREKNPRLGEMTSALIVTGDAAAFEKQREMLGGKNVVAPDGFIIDERGQGLVDVKAITPRTAREAFDSAQVEALADSILELGGLVRPLAVKRTGPESFETVGDDLAYWAAVRAKEKNPRFEMVNSFIYTPSQTRESTPVSVESVSGEQISSIDESARQEAVVAPSPLLDRILAEPTINKRLEIIDGATKEELVSALASRGKEFKPNAGAGMLRSHLKRAVVLEGMKAADVQKFAKQNGLKVGKMKKGDVSNAVLDMVAPRRSEDVDVNPFGVEAIVVDPRKGTGLGAVVEATTPELRKGNINGKRIMLREDVLALQFEPGEVVLTSTGRETTPYPKMDVSTNGKRINSLKRFDQWLLSNAITEAESRGDNMNARIFQGDVDRVGKLPSATRDMAESYLFDPAFVFERQRPLLKSMVEAMETPVDASVKMDTQDGVESEQSESAKEAWRVRRDDWVDGRYRSPGMHRYAVQQALEKGENVPAEVLSDYPEFMMSKIQIPELIDKGVESGNEEAIADDARRDAVDSDGLLEEGAPGTGEIPDSGGVEGRGERDGDARQDGDGYAEGGVSEDDGRRGVVGGEGDVSGASGVGIRKDGGRKGGGKGGKKTALGSQPGTGEATGGDGGKSGTLNPRDNIAGTEPALAGENPGNFSVSEGFSFVLGTPKEKLEANLNAIRTLKQVLDEERYATPEEQAVMAKFVGWGGLPNVFKDESELSGMWLGAHRELKWLFNSRAEWGMSAWNDAMASTRNAHYTSEKVVRMMWDAVRHFGFEGGVALEPTVGVGNFISLQPKDLASATEWHATELDVVTGQLATMLFPNAHVIGGSGFEYAKFRNGVFDIAIGNPPFARDAVRTHAKGYEELKGLSLHNFIVGKSGKHLRPGGVMAMVITHHFLDAGDTRGRAQLAKDFKFLGAVRLPNTAFKANAGTEVTTDIIFLQKLHEGEAPDMKAAWLDSSGKVTNKAGEGVSVNRYFEEHPNHILGEPSMRGKMHAGEEHTVEDDGRDFVKAFGDILAGDFAGLKGTLKPSKRDLDVSAVMAMQSDIPVGGMRLEPDGKIRMRTDDDVSGNSVIVDIVPGIPWGNNAEEWHGMARIARELKEGVSASDLPVKMKEFFAFAKEAGIYNKNDAFAAKTDVGKGIDRLYKAGTEAAGKGSSLEWEFDDILKKIETGRKTRTLSQNNYERLNGLLDLRNRMLALNLAELRDAANMEEIRSGLREAYNNFVETFGHVSSKANRAMIGEDVGAEAGIEIEYDAGVTESQSQKTGAPVREASAVVADILDRRVVHPYREIVSVDGADPALHASIRERGKVDLEYMSEISGKDRDEIVAELASGEAPKIFLNPANNKYEDASEYLSGNVRKKLAEAEKHRMEANVKALRKVQPAPKTAAQVTPSLKGSWIPAGVFERFLSDLGLQNVNVYVSSATGKIVGMASDVALKTEWGGMFNNLDFSILDFFNAATQGKMLKAYVGSGDNRTIDREATDRANMLVEMMSREFEKWARGDAGIMDKIVDAFNEKMNTHVEPKFNGRELLVTAGANPSVEMRDTQKDAAWRMIRTDSVLLDHVVGAGKTYALITGAMERRRMGASKKPLFVVPNHLVGQWTRDFYKLYPGSRVLAASEKSMKPQNRKALFARMATGDFDAVIIGHSHLSFIENAAVDEKAIIDEQLSGLRAALEDAEETGNSRSVKQIQERIDKYKARLAELAEGKRDEIGYDFEKMGIDYLVVDEAHLFKNLEYSSGNPRIAGMNDPKGAAKSFDMYVKTRGLRKRGGGVAFATGTPVSNSLVEIYTMMKYLAYDELASRNLQHFDAWAGAYTITETRLEYTATQKLKPRRVLSSLVNLSSLQQIYKQFADTITLQNLKDAYRIQMERENESLPEGKKKRTEFPVPKIVENPDSGRNERKLDTGEPSEEQTEYFDYLTARMNAIESNARNSEYRRIDNPLWVLNDARIASLDIRTIDPTLPRNGNGKVMRAARNIKRLYDQWDDVRGAQLVFCDDSVPSSGSKAKAKKMFKTFAEGVFGEGDAARIMKRLEGRPFIEQWKGLQSALENLLDSEDSRVKAAEDFLEKNEEKYADFRMTALARTADSGFSVYEDLRKVLSQEMGIPESEIQFIHDHDTTEKKAELFARVNSGNVRILIGSTDMMGAGMNAQERLVALHHLDAPWRPSDLEQREGRIIRQKNELYLADPDGFRIEIIAYSTEKTSDAVMWQTLERKARGIEQFRSGGGVDTLTEEGGNDADQFANFMANTTGNPVFLQKLKAERRYNELEASQSGLIRSKSSAERFMDSFDTEKEKLELAIKNAESASASVIKYGEHKGSGKEIDAVLDAATKAYWAEKEEYDAEYRVYSEEWDRWRSAGADKNTEPKAPTSPVMPWLLSKSVVADSDGAKAIAKAFEDAKKLSSGDHVSIPVGNVEVRIVNYGAGSLSDKKRAEGLKEWGVAFHRNPKGKPDWRIVQTGVEARNLSDLVESVHPKFIERVYANLLVSAKKDLDRMIANRPAMEKMAAMDIDQSEANRALQELAWYQRQVSFAELDADIERADRENRFIEADTFRRLSVKKRDSYGEDRTGDVVKDIDGEEYRLDGHNLGIYTRAFRMKDDVPVVLVSESKDGKTRYVVELEQPASLREGAEETLYQMGDADAAQQMTPEESLKLVQAIRAGDLRSRHLGKVWEGEPPTGPLVRTVIPISEIPDVTIEYMRETSDSERVNRYAKDDIQTPIYLRVNQEGYLVVSDGGHRLLAAIQRGDSTINVLMPANYVRDGDRYVLKSEADLSSDADYLAAVEAGDMETAQRMVDERLAASGAYWHGTPSGDLRGGRSGLHVGTKQAATEALEARIGIPADGKGWDGTREYGKTLLAGRDRVRSGEFGKYRDTGYNAKSPAEDHYPTEMPTVGKGVPVDPTWKPWVRPVLVVSDMSNTPRSPMSDAKANATMAGMLKRGSARRGYFYTNDGEDAGSVSAVLPNGDSVRVKLADPVTYDDSGKIIPLSKRFDSGNEDVRYQRRLTPKSGSYRDNLKKDAAAFAVAVDDTVSGKGEPDSYVNVMTTPLVLSLVGADVLPVQMRRQKLLDVMSKHGLSSEVLKKIPAALADPIMVFKSDLKAKGESLVVMLDLTDDDGATIIAALHLDVVPGRNMYAMNRLASVYGKKDAVENRDAWFVEQMEKGNAKYINKKKSSQWFGRASFFFTGGANLESFITQSVATEADLVKLRNAYPGYYQGEGAEAKGSITFRRGTDARPEIRLFENADASTFMHEAMHFFVDDLLRQMNTGKASDETKNLFRQLNNVARVSKDKNKKFILAEKEHEKLAVGFEAYLERGVAPKGAKGLQGVFEKFKQWLKELFSFARNNNVEMSDALVSFYDTVLTTPEERAAAENVKAEESVETIEAAEVEADVNEGVETVEAEVVEEEDVVDFNSPEGEKELAGQPRAWETPRPSMNPEARALGLRKIRDLVKRIVPWRFGNTEDRTGVYSEREKLIKTKDDYDFPTAMHEVGHHLMKELKLNTGLPKGTLKELEALGKQTARPGAAQDVVLAEGVAQFVQYYIINKAAAKVSAPIFFVEFESRLDNADGKLIEDFGDLRDAVSAFYESSPERRVLAHVRSAGEKKPYSKTLVSSRLKRAIFKSYEGLVDDKHSWNLLTEWIKDTPEGKKEMANNGGFLPDRLDFYAQVSTLAGYMKQADKDVEGMMAMVGKLTKKEYDQLTAYAVSLQSIEYYDNDMNPGTGPRSDHEAVVANTPQHIKDVLKGVQDIYNNMVKETLLDTGVISQEGFDAMRAKWENYVPFMRDLDEDGFIDWLTKGAPKSGANLRSYVDVRNPFMKRYGVAEHERTEIFDPFEVMIHNAVVFHGIKSRNDFAKLVVDAANSLKGFGWLASKSEAMSKADMKEHAVFYVWRDGQKEYYSTDPELYVLLKGMYDSGSKAGNPFIRGALSWMQFAADVFKMGTTRYNPAFMLLNFLRDAQGTAIQSEGWAMPFVATIKGLMLQLSNDPAHKKLIEDAINDGVFYSAITSLPKGTSIDAIAKELRRQRRLASSTGIARTLRNLMETPRSVGGWVGRTNEMIEMAPKLYEYEYLRRTKPKMGGKRAAMKARSVNIDFGRAGTWGRGFNSVTAFFNAGVQGLDKVREVSKQRPMQTFAKVMLYQVLPSVMMRLAILSNPDDEEKYQRIAPGMRDTHFFIPVQLDWLGAGVWTRLPKADNWWIISAVFERMITEAAKKDPEAWRGFANSVVNLLPPYVPTMIAPIIQVWRNTDSFTDSPIVSKRYEHRPDELQFHTGTSETAKLLGKVTKTSPIMLEFMYDKHVGEVGAQVLSLAEWTFDMIGTGMGLMDEKTKMEAGKASDLPFFKRFFYDTTRTGEPLNRFYSYHDQLLDDKKRADAAGTAFEDERLLKAFNRTRAKFTEINREKDDIRLDPDLSRKDKRELIDMLENRAAEYAKAAMAVYYESKGIE